MWIPSSANHFKQQFTILIINMQNRIRNTKCVIAMFYYASECSNIENEKTSSEFIVRKYNWF